MSSVGVKNLVVTQANYPAIADATFELPSHSFLRMTGHNGSGKTTLLKALCGIIPIERGEIVVTSEHLDTPATHKELRMLRRVSAYVGHTLVAMRHITVREHLTLTQRLDPLSVYEWAYSVDEALDLFQLSSRSHVRVHDLSAGQQRRLHIASSCVRSAPILCIDEPHASLDSESKQLIDNVLEEQYQRGRTLIVATHDPDRVAHLATHDCVVAHGVVAVNAQGTKK